MDKPTNTQRTIADPENELRVIDNAPTSATKSTAFANQVHDKTYKWINGIVILSIDEAFVKAITE